MNHPVSFRPQEWTSAYRFPNHTRRVPGSPKGPTTPFFYDRSSREWRKTCDQSIRPVLFSEMPNSFTSDGKETLFFPPDNLSGKINRFPGKKLVFTARNQLWRNRPGLRMPFRKTGQPINRLVSIRPEQRKRNLSQVVYRERVRRACAS